MRGYRPGLVRRWACLLVLLGLSTVTQAGDISYVYDGLGRLIAVIDPATDTAVYSYDAVGNLTGIARQSSATLSVISFTPSWGPVGTAVTIYGTGFDATPANNTIKFNGVTATTLTASTTVLTANVPAGATTGAISVTVGAATATSTNPFTVGLGAAPTITSFTPSIGPSGTVVTITGTNYQTVPGDNRVSFKNAFGSVTTASSTSLDVPVPTGAQSGRIEVTTMNGSVTSSQDFYVTPPGINGTDVAYTGTIVAGGAQVTASIPTANKVALVIFDGIAGQRLSLGLTSVTIPQSALSIYTPDGTLLSQSPNIGTSGGSFDFPVLPVTGTYTILIDPASTYTGNMTLTLSAELTGNLTPGGAPVVAAVTRVGQNARYFFSGTAGQTVSLGMTSVTITSGTVSLWKPDSTALVPPTSFSTAGGAIDTQILPVSGTYFILVDPNLTYTGNITLTLYDTPDVTGTVTIDGTAVTPTLTVPGQRARYTFTGTAGQQLNLGASSVTITNSVVSILKPDGASLASATISTIGGSVDPPALPTSGTYTVVVDPNGLYTGNMTLTLSTPVSGTIAIDGSAVAFTTTRPGQIGTYTVSGTAGQYLSLGLTNSTLLLATVSLLKPDGFTLSSMTIGTSGGSLDPPVLPATGTYTIKVDPYYAYTGSVTLTLSSEVSGTLNINDAATPITISRAGQNARYTFSGTASQQVTVKITGNTLGLVYVYLYNPTGGVVTGTGNSAASFNLSTVTLPSTGTYTVTINPSGLGTGALNLQVTNP